jgi:hypothetical protein
MYTNLFPDLNFGRYTILSHGTDDQYVILNHRFEDIVYSYEIYKDKEFNEIIKMIIQNNKNDIENTVIKYFDDRFEW